MEMASLPSPILSVVLPCLDERENLASVHERPVAPREGPEQVLVVVRRAEIELLGTHVLSGPHAGAGCIDLHPATNRPAAEGAC